MQQIINPSLKDPTTEECDSKSDNRPSPLNTESPILEHKVIIGARRPTERSLYF